MKDTVEISELEESYKKLLMDRLKGDERISVTCPDFKYPEPVFVYIKSVKTDKSIAVRLDGGDKTMRFWDYVDDDYSEEDGVWSPMTEKGLDEFVKKLYEVMGKAIDIEFYGLDNECEDYCSGVAAFELNEVNALKAVKKSGKNIKFAYAKFSDFFGGIQYIFDYNFRQIKR